jgi:long-chain acyl-CoA synthetase
MDFRRLFDILPYQRERFPQKKALAIRGELGWDYYSTEACERIAQCISAGWLKLGLKRGERVGIVAERASPRWMLLDTGLMQAGLVPVPIHSSCSQEELRYILRDSAARFCVAANREAVEKVTAVKEDAPALSEIYSMVHLPDFPSWEDLLTEPTATHLETLQVLRAAIHEDDLATIIYTSGTSGQPKGVMLSHKNIVSNIKATLSLVPVNHKKRALSFLPPSHIFERMVNYSYMACGASVYYSRKREETMALFKEVRPHYFTAVPRLLERAYDEILERLGNRPLPIRWLGHWAIQLGMQYRLRHPGNLWYRFRLGLAKVLVLGRWKRQLGGRIEGVIVGAAALQENLARLFSAAGLPIREGYGMTETSPVIAFNRFEPGGTRFGTVGIPIPGLQLRIANPDEGQEGEIQVKGPNVMLGYYQKPGATDAVFTEDGWLKTGDRGKLVYKRFLQITGREKDLFKTTNGRYIPPEQLENALRSSPYIEECLVIGEQRPFALALILPQFHLLWQWCLEKDVYWTAPQFMIHNHKVEQFLQSEVERINEQLPPYKRIGNFLLLHEAWTTEAGELTPTLKPRREWIVQKFRKEIEARYEQGAKLRG